MRRVAVLAILAIAVACSVSPVPRALGAEWHSEQPVAAGMGVPVPLGPVGDIEFWAPNRGLLITEGNEAMPAGLYAYDGTGWHLYSTVCGGREGRIAWAGPTEFWTVSDYRSTPEGNIGTVDRRTLCHFSGGRVVASFAEPAGSAGAYLPMNGAACAGPSECWFAGERLPGDLNVGAFHLRWNGALTAIPSLTEPQPWLNGPGRTVEDLVVHQGQLFESVRVDPKNDQAPEETEPSLIHRIEPFATPPIVSLFPSYAPGASASTVVGGLRFASDGDELWALAGSKTVERLSAFRYTGGGFVQVPLAQPDPPALLQGDSVKGLAAEPGSDRVWVGLCDSSCGTTFLGGARLVPIGADGAVGREVVLPKPEEGIGNKGHAGPIACPAADQCWMATGKGWLFHLGGPLAQDADPAMHQLITSRPCDNSCRSIPPIGLPVDDSGEALLPIGALEQPPPVEEGPRRRPRPKPLVFKIKQRVLGRSILQLAFSLRARARVQLIAKRRKRTVAKTRRRVFDKGRHRLHLRLDPERWPTDLDFDVHRAGKRKAP